METRDTMDWWTERSGLDGSVAVVSGGAGGLGGAVTLDLAANGVRVAVLDRDAAAVETIQSSLARLGADHLLMLGDARDPDVVGELFTRVDAAWARLDTLVNVVGGTFKAPFSETTPKGWDALLRANLLHVFHATHLAIPRMRAGGRGGSIINLTSIEAHRAAPNFAVYSAAKAAVRHFARSLAVELGPEGIRVNNVAPDITPTENMVRIGGGDMARYRDAVSMPTAVPMGRCGELADVSGVVVFLASKLSAYVTGTTLHPDGGTYASGGFFNWPGTGFGCTLPQDIVDFYLGREQHAAAE